MRLNIQGHSQGLSRAVVREALHFMADALKLPSKVSVYLTFTSAYPRRIGAEMWQNSRRSYSIACSSKNGPYRTLEDLAHEMIHVQQYFDGLVKDGKTGTAWQGKIYRGDFLKQDHAYWEAPWEINANGRAYWLYKRTRIHLIKQGHQLQRQR